VFATKININEGRRTVLFERNKESIDANAPVEPESLEQTAAEQKEKAEKFLANWQRSEADFSNYRKRAEQEKYDIISFANSGLILAILPVLDDIDRAIDSLSPEQEHLNWAEGFKLIQKKLQSVLEAQGLTEIDAQGKPFDPNFHEAIAHIEGEEGVVLSVMQKGYKLKDKVLRPSMVSVGKGTNGNV
jgi:molecular chaperone GrpE